MSKREDAELICDISEAINRIAEYIEKMSYAEFLEDKKTQDAVVRNLEIIGEAAKNISPGFKERFTKIPWRNLAGVRDRLIHHYFGVNFDIVWVIAKDELGGLLLQVNEVNKNQKNNK